MTEEQLVSILNNDDLNVEKEEHVYESIVRWAEHDLPGREAHLAEVFSQCIRLPLLDEAFLSRIPAPFACALSLSKDPTEAKARFTGTNGCPQRLGMTASEMIICFDAAHKHSGKKQTVPCLDAATGRVFKLCKPPNDLREVGILVSSENDIYIAGGYRPSNSEVSIDHRAESDFWQYEHAGNRWLPHAPLLRARIGCRLVHCCGKLYALGGRVYEGDGRNALKSMECYDARDNCWTAVSPMPVAMEFHSALEYRDRIYVLQGELLCFSMALWGSIHRINGIWNSGSAVFLLRRRVFFLLRPPKGLLEPPGPDGRPPEPGSGRPLQELHLLHRRHLQEPPAHLHRGGLRHREELVEPQEGPALRPGHQPLHQSHAAAGEAPPLRAGHAGHGGGVRVPHQPQELPLPVRRRGGRVGQSV